MSDEPTREPATTSPWDDREAAAEPNAEPNVEPNVEPNAEPNVEPNAEPNVEPNAVPTVEPVTEPASARFAEPPFEVGFAPSPPSGEHATAPAAVPLGVRVGGAMLLVNAAVVLLEVAVMGMEEGMAEAGPRPSPLIASVVDVVIGVQLLRGQLAWRTWAIVRCVIGAVVFGALRASTADTLGVVLQLSVSTALLIALVGSAGKVRSGAAMALFTPYLALSLFGIVGLLIGWSPIPGIVMDLSGELEPGEAGEITGVVRPWTITAPAGWRLRTAEAVRRDNPLIDRWLVRPDADAHLIVVAEEVATGMVMLPASFRDSVVENARVGLGAVVVAEETLRDGSTLLRLRGRAPDTGLELEEYIRLVLRPDTAYQVTAFAPRAAFEGLAPELYALLESFEPAVVDDSAELEPGDAGLVTGVTRPWTLSAPAGWRARRAELAAVDNPLADRWLLRPGLDAQLLLLVEPLEPGTALTLADYRAAIVASTEEALGATLRSEETLDDGSVLLRFRGVSPDTEVEIEKHVRLVVRADAAYQVVALVGASTLSILEPELRAMLTSFTAP